MELTSQGREKKVFTLEMIPLTKDDLATLEGPRVGPSPIKRLRDSHHRVARYIAYGFSVVKISKLTGLSPTRISVLRGDPAFADLVSKYSARLEAKLDEVEDAFVELSYSNMIRAEAMISDRIDQAEEDGELLPIRELVSISRDAADRLGYGKHQTQTNVNVDFAKNLEATIRRSRAAQARVINQSAEITRPPTEAGRVDPTAPPALPATIRRIA